MQTMVGSSKAYPPARPLRLVRNARIAATAAGLPDEVVTNQALIDELGLVATDRAVQFSIGIRERRRGDVGTPCAEYLTRAGRLCLERAGVGTEQVDRVIYARLFGDHTVPSTASTLLPRLGLRPGIPAMDISAACSGFLHAMGLALSFINAGDERVLVLGGDRGALDRTARIKPDTRTVFLNGDGFAAMLLERSDEPHFRCSYFYTDSELADLAHVPFGTALLNGIEGSQGGPELGPGMLALQMPDGRRIHQSVLDSCRLIADRLLGEAGLRIEDIDFLVTSDQTHLVWKDQLKLLGVPETKSVSCFPKYGNTVAAMAPLNLDEAIQTGALRRGMTVMMMAHGAGASGGGFIFTY
jgi:3-oxoacyl-[acyl-carrier-protein] synthase-3